MFYERGTDSVTETNSRGDVAAIIVDEHTEPYKSRVVLRRSHGWPETVLMTAENYDFSIGAKWRTDDLLDVQLDLGPDSTHTDPITYVGAITIRYRFGGVDGPKPLPDIKTYISCPAPYPSPYFERCPPIRAIYK